MTRMLPTIIESERPVVAVRGLTKSYGKTRALRELDLTVPEGSFYLLVGPNGAGKTTTMRILLDLTRPDSGSAAVFGMDSLHRGPEVRGCIGHVAEGPIDGFDWMRVGMLLGHHAAYYPSWDDRYAASLAKALEVDLRARYGKLSKGQGRRVQLLMALAHRPPLLLLDEPMDGLDPVVRDRVTSILAEHLAETRTTVLSSTHHIQELERLADHLGVLKEGSLIAQMDRSLIDGRLRRYRLGVPEDWTLPAGLSEAVIGSNGSGSDRVLTIWGDVGSVTDELSQTGAFVREVRPLQLEDAAVSLLNAEGSRS